jgi:hypothetical protein
MSIFSNPILGPFIIIAALGACVLPSYRKFPGFLLPLVFGVQLAAALVNVWARTVQTPLSAQINQGATSLAIGALVLLFVRTIRLYILMGRDGAVPR